MNYSTFLQLLSSEAQDDVVEIQMALEEKEFSFDELIETGSASVRIGGNVYTLVLSVEVDIP